MWIGFLREESASVGMRELYRVTDTMLNSEVAMKVLQPRFAIRSLSWFVLRLRQNLRRRNHWQRV